MEKYSVLMTVYKKDRPDYFAISLDSMIHQTCTPDEIIVVCDGPITFELQEVIDNRIGCGINIHQVNLPQNVGLGLALNEGIRVIRNDLIARMDSDDYSMPNRCELQLKAFEANSYLDIIGCPADEFIGDINHVVGCRNVPADNAAIYRFAKKRDPFNHPTVMYRKSAVVHAGCYSDYRKNQDTDLWIKMLMNHVVCANLTEHVFRFRFDEGTYKKRKSWTNTKTLIIIRYNAWRKKFCSLLDFVEVVIAQVFMYMLPVGFQKFLYTKVLRK